MITILKRLLPLLILLPLGNVKAQTTLLKWPLASDFTTFIYNTDTLDTVFYEKGSEVTEQGIGWRNWPLGSINPIKYFQISFTPSLDDPKKKIQITNIKFSVKNTSFLAPTKFRLAYSTSNDFDSIPSDSVTLLNDVTVSNFFATNIDQDIFNPIQLQSNDTLHLRFYFYNATNPLGVCEILDNTFKISGITTDESEVPIVGNFKFVEGCPALGSLSWKNPPSFSEESDSILVFAKKGSQISFGTPTAEPADYGAADTDLSTLDGTIPATIQYENDADAMLVYNGRAESVDLSNFEDGTTYFFMALNIKNAGAEQVYSDDRSIIGASSNALKDVTDPGVTNQPTQAAVQWTMPNCSDSVMVVCIAGTDASGVLPSGTVTDYTTGLSNNFSTSTAYFNGTDASDGVVVYAGTGETVTITGLTTGTNYRVTIFNESNETWAEGAILALYPGVSEVIITHVKSAGTSSLLPDFIEFITLTTIRFDTAQYNLTNKSVCAEGWFYSGGTSVSATGPTYFNSLGEVPAGTLVRSYAYTGTSVDTDASDGIVVLNNNSLLLKDAGGEQVILFNGAIQESDPCPTDPGSGPNVYQSALNFGNSGWLRDADNDFPDGAASFEPPSVSNLAAPAGAAEASNWALKDNVVISGDKFEIHGAITPISSDNWSAGGGSSPALRLKNIQFEESDVTGDSVLTEATGDVVVTLNDNITVTDSVDVRYLVVVNTSEPPSVPVDRYTCYTPSLDYSAADTVVSAVASQVANQDPCGVRTNGNGRIVYLGRDTTHFTVTNIPCGSYVYVSVYALKGNGYTANIGEGITDSILLATVSTETYYSQFSGNFLETNIFNSASGGGGGNFTGGVDDIGDCIEFIIQSGDTVEFPDNMLIGNLTVESGGRAVITADDLFITQDLTANDSLVTGLGTRMHFNGVRKKNIISGSGYIEMARMDVNNTNAAVNQDKLEIQTNVYIREGINVQSGDIVVTAGDTVHMMSEVANKMAYIGKLPAATSISGDFAFHRYLPYINVEFVQPSGTAPGVGWRYLGSPVTDATYGDIADDFTCTGFTGIPYAGFLDINGHYFPNLQKYDETVSGVRSFGFDGDYFDGVDNTPTTPPNIRNRRDVDEPLNSGEGVFAYIGPMPNTFDITGTPFTGSLDQTLSVTTGGEGADEDGWNLVANPYPCPVFTRTVSVIGTIDNTIYIYDASTGVYEPFDRTGFGTVVATGQAFWAHGTGIAPVFEWEEVDKNPVSNATFIKSNEDRFERALVVHIAMDTNQVYADRTYIRFESEATPGFEPTYDGYKLYSLVNTVPGIATTIPGFEKDASVNAIPDLTASVTIPIKINARVATQYNLNFSQMGDYVLGQCLTLYDAELDSTLSVDLNSTYSFYSELRAEDAEPRFYLTLTPGLDLETADVACFEATDGSATASSVNGSPVTFTWYDESDGVILEENNVLSSTIENLAYGSYKVVLTDETLDCGSVEKAFFIAQPAPYENSISKFDPTCNAATGWINVFLDTTTTWSIEWENLTGAGGGSVHNVNEFYAITSAGKGLWQITTSNGCSSMVFETELDDGNPVEASFEMSADTVYISEGGEATFTNTSLNGSQFVWWYGDTQEVPDTTYEGSFVFSNPGVYNITLIAENESGCYDVYDQELVVLQAVGVRDIENHGLIKSYISYTGSNPQYVIQLKEDQLIRVDVVSYTGQRMDVIQVATAGETRIDLPVYGWSAGMYLLITTADGDRIDTQKLLVR